MENRKNEKANLDKVKHVFRGIGFVCIIGLVFLTFTLKTYDKVSYDFKVSIDEIQDDLPPLIAPVVPPPPPPPPKQEKKPQEPELEIVEDDVEVEEEEFEDEDDEDIEIEEGPEEEETEELEAVPLTFVKNMPHYKSCASGNNSERDRCTRQMFDRKIREAFVYPDIAQEMGLEGIVYVQFVVSSSGKVENVKVIKGVHKHLDNAAIKAVQKLPQLIPGKQLDKPVSLLYTVPVKIILD
jgi:protein TonB